MMSPDAYPRRHQAHDHPIDPASWLSALQDDLPISEINIPGSHNAAAINSIEPTNWACQAHSIKEQLERGIRLLDIRLKPKKRNSAYHFVTCHGRLGSFGANEFQPFDEVLEECTKFLAKNPGETIIMTIQIDDWRRTKKQDRPQILKILQTRLNLIPLVNALHLPTLKECRGRIFLINRINGDPALGVPINIPGNTPGTTLTATPQRPYAVYVQDQYKKLDYRGREAHKLRLTIAAFENKRPGEILLNFASATGPVGRLVYIMRGLMEYCGKPAVGHRNAAPIRGWLFLDYACTSFSTDHRETLDLPTLIIESNFEIQPHPFRIKRQISRLPY